MVSRLRLWIGISLVTGNAFILMIVKEFHFPHKKCPVRGGHCIIPIGPFLNHIPLIQHGGSSSSVFSEWSQNTSQCCSTGTLGKTYRAIVKLHWTAFCFNFGRLIPTVRSSVPRILTISGIRDIKYEFGLVLIEKVYHFLLWMFDWNYFRPPLMINIIHGPRSLQWNSVVITVLEFSMVFIPLSAGLWWCDVSKLLITADIIYSFVNNHTLK